MVDARFRYQKCSLRLSVGTKVGQEPIHESFAGKLNEALVSRNWSCNKNVNTVMRIAYASDLHFEFGGPRPSLERVKDADVIVLAGDICSGRGGASNKPLMIEYAKSYADEFQIPVVTVLGNHELYGEEYHSYLEDCRCSAAEHTLVHLLENDAIRLQGIRFLGCTLWTDFKLSADENSAKQEAYNCINDYKLIGVLDEQGHPRCLSPDHTVKFNCVSKRFLYRELRKKDMEPTVVITHFPPVFMSDPKFEGDTLSAYFCNNWENEIRAGLLSPDIWIAGHTHFSADFHVGETRILSRQGGYPGELEPFEWGIVSLAR